MNRETRGWILFAALPALLLVAGCSLSRLSPEQIALYEQLSSASEPDVHHDVCPVHRVPTEVRSVPAYGGFAVLPSKQYIRARLDLFPNSFLYTQTGWCEQSSVFYVDRWVCPACRAAEVQWRQSHGYEIPEDTPTDGLLSQSPAGD